MLLHPNNTFDAHVMGNMFVMKVWLWFNSDMFHLFVQNDDLFAYKYWITSISFGKMRLLIIYSV